jgi:ABC-type glycerol-3-phosphate transport system substrate-binding protein
MDAAVSEFNRANIWGITVSAASQGSILALDGAISTPTAGNPLPQVIAIPPEYIAGYPAVAPMDDYLQDPQWGLTSPEEADFFPSFWNEGQAAAPRYSIPLLRSMAVLYYNQGWAKELGFTQAPSAPADFKTQVCAAGKAVAATGNPDTNGTGGWIVNTSGTTDYSWLAAFGAVPSLSPADVQLYDNNNSDVAFTYLRKMFDTSCAWVSRNPTPYTYFAGRQALLFSGTLEDLPALSAAMTYQKNSDGWTVLPYPTDNAQKTLITFGPSLAILKSSPQQQLAAWLFVRWMELPRIQARLAAAGSSLPVRKSALDLMADFAKANPQWAIAAGWLKGQTQSLPVQLWWKVTQRVLEDGAGQVFQPFLKVANVPDVLKELDATVAELLNKK